MRLEIEYEMTSRISMVELARLPSYEIKASRPSVPLICSTFAAWRQECTERRAKRRAQSKEHRGAEERHGETELSDHVRCDQVAPTVTELVGSNINFSAPLFGPLLAPLALLPSCLLAFLLASLRKYFASLLGRDFLAFAPPAGSLFSSLFPRAPLALFAPLSVCSLAALFAPLAALFAPLFVCPRWIHELLRLLLCSTIHLFGGWLLCLYISSLHYFAPVFRAYIFQRIKFQE